MRVCGRRVRGLRRRRAGGALRRGWRLGARACTLARVARRRNRRHGSRRRRNRRHARLSAPPRSTSGERSHSDACAVAAGVMRRWPTWSASMDAFDVEVCALRLPGGPTLVELPLAPSHWRACDKKGFFPRAVARAGFEPLLRRSVCFAMLQLAEVGPGDVIVDPMAGSGSLPVEAASAFGARWVLGGDLTRVATRQANCAPRLPGARGGALGRAAAAAAQRRRRRRRHRHPVGQPQPRRPAAAARRARRGEEAAAPRRPRRAPHDARRRRRVRLDSGLEAEATLDVVVGGWPAAIVRLRKGLGDVARAAAPPAAALGTAALEAAATAAAAVDDDDDDVPAFAGVARSALTPCCCAVVVGVLYAELSVAEILLSEWPELVPTISAARRAIKHRRVSRASALDTHVVWWRDKVAVGSASSSARTSRATSRTTSRCACCGRRATSSACASRRACRCCAAAARSPTRSTPCRRRAAPRPPRRCRRPAAAAPTPAPRQRRCRGRPRTTATAASAARGW